MADDPQNNTGEENIEQNDSNLNEANFPMELRDSSQKEEPQPKSQQQNQPEDLNPVINQQADKTEKATKKVTPEPQKETRSPKNIEHKEDKRPEAPAQVIQISRNANISPENQENKIIKNTKKSEQTPPSHQENIPEQINERPPALQEEQSFTEESRTYTQEESDETVSLAETTMIDYYLYLTLKSTREFIPKLYQSLEKISETLPEEQRSILPNEVMPQNEFLNQKINDQMSFFLNCHKDVKIMLLENVNPYSIIQINGLVDTFKVELQSSIQFETSFQPITTIERINSEYNQRLLKEMNKRGVERSPADIGNIKNPDLVKSIISGALSQTLPDDQNLQSKHMNSIRNFQPNHNWQEFAKKLQHPEVGSPISEEFMQQKIIPKRKIPIPGLSFDTNKKYRAKVISVTGDMPLTQEEERMNETIDAALAHQFLAQAALQAGRAVLEKRKMSQEEAGEIAEGQNEAQKQQEDFLKKMQKGLTEAQAAQHETEKNARVSSVAKKSKSFINIDNIAWITAGGEGLPFLGAGIFAAASSETDTVATLTALGTTGLDFIQSIFA